ncbi:unnamed protein product [Orchesella dallaii]|uniref:Uncharacterized protein n=1 Tax=Orchesella dallaii TaxID=48710 RepID=A0ABP1PTN5_9HEXA
MPGKKEPSEKEPFVPPVVRKYRVEVLNVSQSNAVVWVGNAGHSMETTLNGKAMGPKYWEIEFTDVPDIKIYGPSGKKSFGLKESHNITNSYLIQDNCISCKNQTPLAPRHTTANPEIYGTKQEQHIEVLKNSSRKDANYFIGDDWHNITGVLESGGVMTWKLVISQIPQMITHQWCKIEELGSRRNKFSVVGARKFVDGEEHEDIEVDYCDHVFEINDNWELLRNGVRQKLWKWDWE